jgi:hypothetical protein
MPKCPGCNKFAGIMEADPDLNSDEVTFHYDDKGQLESVEVELEAHIVNQSECCGDDMTEADLTISQTFAGDDLKPLKGHTEKEGHELSYEVDGGERIQESGKGRRAPTYYGASYTVTVTCSCGKLASANGAEFHVQDTIQASSMDEMN